ncbi:MAG TPA: four helix bundle protein [Anaerolineae bacterium]|nr:four helix bundle protein [Anaerolineae bacterium]HIP73371.1 four helix bundle protein [Anaerolineae bacterium]
MTVTFEELRVLQAAEKIADGLWPELVGWDPFARDTIGKQLARAADSIGANIAEAYGRYHYGEKLRFLYYARGSLYETKYWLNRARVRHIISNDSALAYANDLSSLAFQLNTFAKATKTQKSAASSTKNTLREASPTYQINTPHAENTNQFIHNEKSKLFTPKEITNLKTFPTT